MPTLATFPGIILLDPETGLPLSGGKVYIGIVDEDPTVEANRVDVVIIQESGVPVTVLPAAQPFILNSGAGWEYNGSPVIATVETNFSMTVLRSDDSQAYYFPDTNFQIVDEDIQNSSSTLLRNVTGTNTVTATLTPTLTAYEVGQVFHGLAANTNAGAVTLNINGLGAGAVQINNAALTGGELLIGAPFEVQVTSVAPIFEIQSQANNTVARALLAATTAADQRTALGVPAASEGAAGIVELATIAEILAGLDLLRAMTPGGFAGSMLLAANGYYKFPGGFIVQWGTVTTDGFGEGTITFPTPFITGCYACVGTNQDISIPLVFTAEAPSLTGADVKTEDTAGAVQAGVSGWIAVGK